MTTRSARAATKSRATDRKRTRTSNPRDAQRASGNRSRTRVDRSDADGVRHGRASAVRQDDVRSGGDGAQRKRRRSTADRAADSSAVRADRGAKTPRVRKARTLVGFVDRDGNALSQGATVRFHSYRGTVMSAVVQDTTNVGQMVSVLIGNDPFPTYVDRAQVELVSKGEGTDMPETTAPTARELRQQAKRLGVPDWEVMDRDELASAVANYGGAEESSEEDTTEGEGAVSTTKRTKKRTGTRSSSTTPKKRTRTASAGESRRSRTTADKPKKRVAKKAPAAKKSTRRAAPRPAEVPEGPNPFRHGSNLYLITEELMKGGKRSTLVKRLKNKLEYNPRKKSSAQFDIEAETDRRLKIVGYILRNQHGFEYTHEGRGPDAYIQATPPE